MSERRHNKMYREIEGYEDGMGYACDVKDELDEVLDKLRYGYPKEDALTSIDRAQRYLHELYAAVSNGGYKIEE